MFATIREVVPIFLWLVRSEKPGRVVLEELCRLTFDVLSMCFVVLDKEAVQKTIRTEITGLLHGLATGKIRFENERKFTSYLVNRYNRLTSNLLKARSITNGDIFVSESSLLEVEERADSFDVFVYHHQGENCFLDVPEKGKHSGWEKMREKEQTILRISQFFPECVQKEQENCEMRQLSLF